MAEEEKEPVVQTKQGRVRGFRVTSFREEEIIAFLGIPYAKPPVGNLRFKAPQPPESWNGTFEAFEEGSACPQFKGGKILDNEDCLFLNVFTKKLPVTGREPEAVMVWIHGGSYTGGSGSGFIYGPDHLLTKDVVVVTINYRLGMLGFLHLPEAGVGGNNGLKDQTMALRWVQDNIAKFGGDPRRVTIFGESAGGASVHFHMLSSMSRGLFHRVIAQSGTVLSPWAYANPEFSREIANVQGKHINCNASNDQELLRCFQKTSVEKLVVSIKSNASETTLFTLNSLQKRSLAYQQQATCFQTETADASRSSRLDAQFPGHWIGRRGPVVPFYRSSYYMPFRPTLDNGGARDEEVFLPADPHAMLSAGNFSDVPAIFGSTNGEANVCVQYVRYLNKTFKEAAMNELAKVIAPMSSEAQGRAITRKAWDFYVGNESFRKESFIDMLTDLGFAAGVVRSLSLQSASASSPLFQYVFGFEGALNLVKLNLAHNEKGASHGDDVPYLFHTALSHSLDDGSEEMITISRMVRMWTNFAKTGTPSGDMKWQPFTVDSPMYLYIGKDLIVRRDLLGRRMGFWVDNMWSK
ncbi:juvenile hormone esterase-like [Periplaneta americana]|uniref:juvenile hormone esterase-like n=1 Tax=Periplaneta americana TaxID=6978 RepID=UPI0037E7BB94